MKNVLLLTDFSSNAWDAHCYATELFKHEECHFIVLHSVLPHDYDSMATIGLSNETSPLDFSGSEKIKEEMTECIHRLNLFKNPRHTFEGIIRMAFLPDCVNSIIKEKGIVLIVMGTNGVKKAAGIYFGSNTINIINKVNLCPVIAIPENVEFAGLKQVVLPTDYNTKINKECIASLIDLVNDFDATIRVLYIVPNEKELSDKQKQNQNILANSLTANTHYFHTLINFDPILGISCFTQSHQADLIAFVTKKHSFLSLLTEKPIIKGVSYYGNTPILVMPQKNIP